MLPAISHFFILDKPELLLNNKSGYNQENRNRKLKYDK